MLQSFTNTSQPQEGAARLQKLRNLLTQRGYDGLLVPRADAHQGEYVGPHDERLAYVSGFTGSAGFLIILPQIAGVFIDGRYRTQVKTQVDLSVFTPVEWPETDAGTWIITHLAQGRIAFDPWLHTPDEIEKLTRSFEGRDITLCPTENLVDLIWQDQPKRSCSPAFVQPNHLAGETMDEKKAHIGQTLQGRGADLVVLTLPDSLCWLLNLRGGDVARNPILHGFALLWADGYLDLFVDSNKIGEDVAAHLGPKTRLLLPNKLTDTLEKLGAYKVMIDPSTAPIACLSALQKGGVHILRDDDPCRLPKACKNPIEIDATKQAHLRDGAAVCAFLHWLDNQPENAGLTEIDIVKQLEEYRTATNHLHDLSFDTICGAGPNGAIMHYRVTQDNNRTLRWGEPLLVDSGGQYHDGTTDITRTIAMGPQLPEVCDIYTRVLKGLIALSRIRFPYGVAGCHLDVLARAPLWMAGQDFDHGTGHGVGVFLSVHEGPQRISRLSDVPLNEGMILSNEPGYYRPGSFGIRLENLIVVTKAPTISCSDAHRKQLSFETLTLVPFDRRMIVRALMSADEISWLDIYHSAVHEKIAPLLEAKARAWLVDATRPL